MAMKPYPSNLIIFNLDERNFSEEVKLAIIRSWVHIGQVLVRTHAAEDDGEPANFMHVMVKYGTRPYLYSDKVGADENWNERVEHHLLSTMRKVSNNNIAFNRTQRRNGNPEVKLDYIEFELEQGKFTLELKLDSNGAVPLSCAELATEVRAKLNSGEIGQPVRVRIPSAASYGAQANDAAEAKAAAAAAAQAEAERLAAEAETTQEAEEASFTEEPELVAEVEQEEAAQMPDSPLEVKPMTEEEWEANYGVPKADFVLDYHCAEAIYADGSSKEFSLDWGGQECTSDPSDEAVESPADADIGSTNEQSAVA